MKNYLKFNITHIKYVQKQAFPVYFHIKNNQIEYETDKLNSEKDKITKTFFFQIDNQTNEEELIEISIFKSNLYIFKSKIGKEIIKINVNRLNNYKKVVFINDKDKNTIVELGIFLSFEKNIKARDHNLNKSDKAIMKNEYCNENFNLQQISKMDISNLEIADKAIDAENIGNFKDFIKNIHRLLKEEEERNLVLKNEIKEADLSKYYMEYII